VAGCTLSLGKGLMSDGEHQGLIGPAVGIVAVDAAITMRNNSLMVLLEHSGGKVMALGT
jgi:hypothetical protein